MAVGAEHNALIYFFLDYFPGAAVMGHFPYTPVLRAVNVVEVINAVWKYSTTVSTLSTTILNCLPL